MAMVGAPFDAPERMHERSLIDIPQALPIEEADKAKLLPIKSPLLRLRLVVHWIEQLNSNWFVRQTRARRGTMDEIDPDALPRWFPNGCIVS